MLTPFEIHAALTHFPIALLLTAVAFDLVGSAKRSPSWRSAGLWALAAGVLGALPALAAGVWLAAGVFRTVDAVPAVARWHAGAGLAASILAATALLTRLRLRDSSAPVPAVALFLEVLAAASVGGAGYLGGQMVMASRRPPESATATSAGAPTPAPALRLDLVARGRALFAGDDTGCTNCHAVRSGDKSFATNLAGVGLRRPDRAWHIAHLNDPAGVTRGSMMPSFRHLPADGKDALAEYLVSLR